MIINDSNNEKVDLNENDVDVISMTPKYQGFFKINEYQLTHKLFNGGQSKSFTRELFERGDGVVLLPYDPVADVVVLQKQFRIGAIREGDNPWLLECVAGMFGKDESPIEVAVREAEEEANLKINPGEVEPIIQYYVSPGGTNEKIHLYVGKVDSANAGGIYGLPEENEDIRVECFTRQEALTLLSTGKIINGATIIALQWLALNAEQVKNRWNS